MIPLLDFPGGPGQWPLGFPLLDFPGPSGQWPLGFTESTIWAQGGAVSRRSWQCSHGQEGGRGGAEQDQEVQVRGGERQSRERLSRWQQRLRRGSQGFAPPIGANCHKSFLSAIGLQYLPECLAGQAIVKSRGLMPKYGSWPWRLCLQTNMVWQGPLSHMSYDLVASLQVLLPWRVGCLVDICRNHPWQPGGESSLYQEKPFHDLKMEGKGSKAHKSTLENI